jgi:type IV pilus assembly protein PilV
MKKNNGFSFIEIMVCVVILSTGLLGLIGLQARGLRNNVSANQRTQATLLAYNIIDRMRANTREVVSFTDSTKNAYYNPSLSPATKKNKATKLKTTSAYVTAVLSDTTVPDVACQPTTAGTPAITCTSAKMAINDLVKWNRELLCNGGALGRITYTPPTIANPDFFTLTVTISWDDNRNDFVDNRDPIDPTKSCYKDVDNGETVLPTLLSTPVQYDPCFRTEFKVAVPIEKPV